MSSVLYEVKNNIAFLTLNRPEKYNAFNREMALQLQQHLDACAKNADVRCVLLTGAGKAFSAGQDLDEVVAPDGPEVATILDEHYNPLVQRIRVLEKPVVAAVNGVAAGAGANLAICCDIAVASRSATFIQAFCRIGLIPDTGGTFFLPRLVGMQKALGLTLLGEKITADEAERIGMIYKVYDDAEFVAASVKLAEQLAQLPPKAIALTKRAMNHSFVSSLDDQLHDEEILQQQASRTQDFKEGVQAFLEKRTPQFKGK